MKFLPKLPLKNPFFVLAPQVIVLGIVLIAAAIAPQTEGIRSKVLALAGQTYSSSSSDNQTIQSEEITPSPTITETPTPTPIPATPTPIVSPTPNPTAAPQLPSSPPSSGYSRISVTTSAGSFTVDVIVADLSNTKVIVDTASASDCHDNCPVLSLGDYVARNGAFAGMNGNFFCPASYPSCAGKTNSFDTLVMNKDKHYFNSDNNVYSVVPAVVFSPGSIRFIGQSQQWGRDTSIDSMIANYPLYLSGGNNVYGGSSDPKIADRGSRSFVGASGGKIYLGYIYNAGAGMVPDILKSMGIQDAIGMDQGGSTALWANGHYVAGPGRGIPNAILLVHR